jgi:hypothetical protein
VCAFLQGKAHEVQGTHETQQEIGDMGHPAIIAGIEFKSGFHEGPVADAMSWRD